MKKIILLLAVAALAFGCKKDNMNGSYDNSNGSNTNGSTGSYSNGTNSMATTNAP